MHWGLQAVLPPPIGLGLSKRMPAIVAKDGVIDNRNANDLGRFAQPLRDLAILRGRRRIATRVIVHEDDGAGVREDRGLENLSRMHERSGERPARSVIDADHLVATIYEETQKSFPLPTPRFRAEQMEDIRRSPQRELVGPDGFIMNDFDPDSWQSAVALVQCNLPFTAQKQERGSRNLRLPQWRPPSARSRRPVTTDPRNGCNLR